MISSLPTIADVDQMMCTGVGEGILEAVRFPTGLCHYVFDVTSKSGRRWVVRVAMPQNAYLLEGSVYWSSVLRGVGVPLPDIFFRGSLADLHFTILQRLPGTDLGYVLEDLSSMQRRAIARELVRIQNLVGSLPRGKGYGFVTSYEQAFPSDTWSGVIAALLARSRARCQAAGIVDPVQVDRVSAHASRFASYFGDVEPVAFLHDATTKNVIVDNGVMTGIVDVDEVCFGDRLLPIGLTRMAILDRGWNEAYVADLCEFSGLDDRRRTVLDFYTALYCVDFLGEIGQAFNRDAPEQATGEVVRRRLRILDSLLADFSTRKS